MDVDIVSGFRIAFGMSGKVVSVLDAPFADLGPSRIAVIVLFAEIGAALASADLRTVFALLTAEPAILMGCFGLTEAESVPLKDCACPIFFCDLAGISARALLAVHRELRLEYLTMTF